MKSDDKPISVGLNTGILAQSDNVVFASGMFEVMTAFTVHCEEIKVKITTITKQIKLVVTLMSNHG